MCIPIDRPAEFKGKHKGFEYEIIPNGRGYRCGYVKVEPPHPWHGKDDSDLYDVDCHGGITFGEADQPCEKAGEDDGWWVGFDCAHGGDSPDPDIPDQDGCGAYSDFTWMRGIGGDLPSGYGGEIRSLAFAKAECLKIIDQAIEAAA